MQNAFSTLGFQGSGRTPGSKPSHRHIHHSMVSLATLLAVTIGLFGSDVSVTAAEPIITLKMAKLEISDRRFTTSRERFAATVPVATVETVNQPPPENFKSLMVEKFNLPTTSLLAKPEATPINPLEITRRISRSNSRVGLWASATFQAGYGQIFFDQIEKTYCPTSTGWEVPGCGYLKIRFKF